MKYILTLLGLIISLGLTAQTATISGKVVDIDTGAPIEFATVYLDSTQVVTETSMNGRYSLKVPAGKEVVLVVTRIGYKEGRKEVEAMPANTTRQIDVRLAALESTLEVVVTESKIEDAGSVRQDVSALKLLPTTTGNLESMLPSIALGTSSGSGGELSSQYNVRGGNYDENLVYVNDFEIYRPQLIRSGQQEGLTFANIDLIRDLTFSSGGFEARYGDKMSSVLDVTYKRPDSLRASLGLSFLGGSAHIEGSKNIGTSSYRKFRYLVGARYKTTRYLLGSLDVKGEYQPNFADIQGYFTYDINPDWQVGLLMNYNRSEYNFAPQTRSTGVGLINYALELYSVFDGSERDDFTTSMAGLSLTYLPDRDRNPYYLKFLTSTYRSDENERIDIIGQYSLREIDSGLGSSSFGEVIAELGAGTQHQFVRNALDVQVVNAKHLGGMELQIDKEESDETATHFLQWGAGVDLQYVNDWINEWERIDSAGYSLSYDTTLVLLDQVYKSRNSFTNQQYWVYGQDTYTWRKESVAEVKTTLGFRGMYNNLSGELLLSPRAQLLYKPLKSKKDITWRLSSGMYYQPAFYREMRLNNGTLNTGLLAQKSVHFLTGFSYDFEAGKKNPKKFRFIAEAYYKYLWDVVSYEIDNVRLQYSGQNDATGYVTGLDLRLNGEFVPGAESWVNLSLLRARERLDGVQHKIRELGKEEGTPVDYVPRPTDQLYNLSVFFQDYLKNNENIKVHVNIVVGGGLPFGLKDKNEIYRNTYRMSGYHRVDIGFSFALWNEAKRAKRPQHWLRFTKDTWLSLEVFNLLQIRNQAGNTWIKTVFDQQYAIPNYLTSRRLNLRLKMNF